VQVGQHKQQESIDKLIDVQDQQSEILRGINLSLGKLTCFSPNGKPPSGNPPK
jgi:hypothetical protein